MPAKVYFQDLNADGISERIEFHENDLGFGSVKIFDPNHRGQANTKNQMSKSINPGKFGDCDNNGVSEIYFTGQRNDSLFVNVVDYSALESKRILSNADEHFIYYIGPGKDFGWGIADFADLNNDGTKELIITINAGYSLQPRMLLAYDMKNRRMKQTPESGSKLGIDFIADTDDNNYPELYFGTFAYRNFENKKVPYTDTCVWLMAFDHHLQHFFEPVLLTKEKTGATVFPLRTNDSTSLFVAMQAVSNLEEPLKFFIISTAGEILKKLELPFDEPKLARQWSPMIFNTHFNNKPVLFLAGHTGNIYYLNKKLELKYSHFLEGLKYPSLKARHDMNHDGNPEFIVTSGFATDYVVIDSKLKHPAFFSLPVTSEGPARIGFQKRKNKNDLIYIQNNNQLFFYSYRQNPLWNIRFLIWGALFFGIYGLLWLLQFIQKERIKNQLETRQHIKELQFKVITSQLNPHFTFNALNTISSSIYDPDKPEVYDRFTTFSRLIRSILSDSDKIARTLQSELNFTKDFLKIQKLRFKEAFDYKIEMDKHVNQKILVPKLIIQIFVENAIKHGFPNHQNKDMLVIRIQKEDGFLKIEIEDNGIGRAKAKLRMQRMKNTGMGLSVMNEYIALLNRQNLQKIKITVIDLKGDRTGTLVRVLIPENFKYDSK